MSALVGFNRILIFFNLFRCLLKYRKEGNQVCSWEREVLFNSLFKQLWYSLILHQKSTSECFLKISAMWNLKPYQWNSCTLLCKNPLVYLCLILKSLVLVIWKTLAKLGKTKCWHISLYLKISPLLKDFPDYEVIVSFGKLLSSKRQTQVFQNF